MMLIDFYALDKHLLILVTVRLDALELGHAFNTAVVCRAINAF